MARRPRSMPVDRPLRMGDISRAGQANLNAQMRNLGYAKRDQPGLMSALSETITDPSRPEKTRNAAQRRIITHEAMAEANVFTNKPITMAGAVHSQHGMVVSAQARARRDAPMVGGGSQGAGLGHLGADWYFQHHAKLAAVAEATGHTRQQVIAASAVMSPQNNPDQEYAAVHALAHAHADPNARVRVSPEAVAASGNAALGDYVGKWVHPSKMSAAAFASVKDPTVREHVQTRGNVDLEAMAKGGTSENVIKAVNVLRGKTHPGQAIDPSTSPKVWSYHEAIKNSEPGTDQHAEFMNRMDVALRQTKGQQRMDLWGLKSSTEGILSPTHPIANDTWMQALQSGQQIEAVSTGRSGKAKFQSPAKFGVGEAGAASEKRLRAGGVLPGSSPPTLRHAWGQESVERLARHMSAESGEIIPSVGAQAVPWTEARRRAGGGKDLPYERMVAQHQAATSDTLPIHPGQGSMFKFEGDDINVNPQAVAKRSQIRSAQRRVGQLRQGSLF